MNWPGILGAAARNFYKDDCLDRAAAVAYYSLLSLGPSLYLLSLVMRALLPDVAGAPGAAIRGAAAFVPPEVAPVVERLAESLRLDDSLVAVALPGLLWMATSAFLSLELAVNVAFRTVEQRRFWLARLKAFAGSALAGSMLLASAATSQALGWIQRSRGSMLFPGGATLIYGGVAFAAFTLLYKILPRGRVRWRIAAGASAACVILWEIARRVFGGLLAGSPGYGLLTGSLAGIVAFLLWVYTAVALLLFGAEVAAVLNGNRRVIRAEPAGGRGLP
jgi:membrane protein